MCATSARALLLSLCLLGAAPVAVAAEPGRGAEAARYAAMVESEAEFRSAVSAHRRGDLQAAGAGYQHAVEHDPGFVEAMVNLARVQVALGELALAADWLDRAERRRPDYPGIEAARGLLALASGDAALAVHALGKARSELPRDVEVLTNLAAGLIAQGRHADALRPLAEAERAEPHRPETLFNLALAHDALGDAPRAAHY